MRESSSMLLMKQGPIQNSAHQINLPLPLPAMAHKPRESWLYDRVLLLVRICSERLLLHSQHYWWDQLLLNICFYIFSLSYTTRLLPLTWWLCWRVPTFCGSSCYRSAPLSALASGEKPLNILALMFINQGLTKVVPSHQQLPYNRYCVQKCPEKFTWETFFAQDTLQNIVKDLCTCKKM